MYIKFRSLSYDSETETTQRVRSVDVHTGYFGNEIKVYWVYDPYFETLTWVEEDDVIDFFNDRMEPVLP